MGSKAVAVPAYNRPVMRLPLRYFDLSRDMSNSDKYAILLARLAPYRVWVTLVSRYSGVFLLKSCPSLFPRIRNVLRGKPVIGI